MISGLRGRIIEKDLDSIIIDVNGVGYKVFVSNSTLEEVNNINQEEEIFIHTYLAVRETALDLYGFTNIDDEKLFKLLLTISGIGPKSAITIMSSITKDMIEESIAQNDAKYLSKISGIGKKTAEKILIGLKDKMGAIESSTNTSDSTVAIDALVALGYSDRDSREIIRSIDVKDKNTEEIIKEALKELGK